MPPTPRSSTGFAPDVQARTGAGPQGLIRHLNRVALLRLLRDAPGLSRAQLAERSGLARSTVSLLIQDLIDQGWLTEDAAEATGARGRRPTPLRLDGRGFALVGAELAPGVIRAVVLSVQGQELHAESQALPTHDVDAVCRQLGNLVRSVAVRARRQLGRRVLGVGVGLPGAVDADTGMLRVAPNLGWRSVPMAAMLQAALGRDQGPGDIEPPVLMQNEADLAAIGEMEFGPRPVASPLVYVSCGIGLGSGIVVDASLFTGASGAAGEVGHTTLRPGGRLCSCGRQGCAEAYVGLRALAAQAMPQHTGIDHDGLRERLARRDAGTLAAFHEAGRDLGVLLHNLWALVDPQLIVLGGETVVLGGDDFVEPARQGLVAYARDAGLAAPRLRVARFGEKSVAMGGAALVLRRLLQAQPAQGLN